MALQGPWARGAVFASLAMLLSEPPLLHAARQRPAFDASALLDTAEGAAEGAAEAQRRVAGEEEGPSAKVASPEAKAGAKDGSKSMVKGKSKPRENDKAAKISGAEQMGAHGSAPPSGNVSQDGKVSSTSSSRGGKKTQLTSSKNSSGLGRATSDGGGKSVSEPPKGSAVCCRCGDTIVWSQNGGCMMCKTTVEKRMAPPPGCDAKLLMKGAHACSSKCAAMMKDGHTHAAAGNASAALGAASQTKKNHTGATTHVKAGGDKVDVKGNTSKPMTL